MCRVPRRSYSPARGVGSENFTTEVVVKYETKYTCSIPAFTSLIFHNDALYIIVFRFCCMSFLNFSSFSV